jgi:hypothetical protein
MLIVQRFNRIRDNRIRDRSNIGAPAPGSRDNRIRDRSNIGAPAPGSRGACQLRSGGSRIRADSVGTKAGEVLLLTQKIKADGKTYENGSRQMITAIERDKIRFESGLELRVDDGRVRQGDAVTTCKAQGASKTEMIRVEDNLSLLAMANREDRSNIARGFMRLGAGQILSERRV